MVSHLKKSIQPIYNWWYSIILSLFFLHQYLEYNEWSNRLMRSYFDDLLVLPIILPFTLVLIRLIFRNAQLKLGITLVVTALIMITLVFEFILPNYAEKYTKDYLDIIAYTIGGIIYIIYERIAIN